MNPRTYVGHLNDLVISAALNGGRYELPTTSFKTLTAGGIPNLSGNPIADISSLRYASIPPKPLTYERLLGRAGEPMLPPSSDRVVFAWSPDALTATSADRAVGCIRLTDARTARESIALYRAAGIPPARIVVAGSINALNDEAYDELLETGVVLEELDWERYGSAGRARLERAMEPFFRALLHLGPTFIDMAPRPYAYQSTPTPAPDSELRRIGELLRGDDEMFD